MIQIEVDSFEKSIPELGAIHEEHYQEIAEHKDQIPLDFDYEQYVNLEKEGKLLFISVRDEGKLIGYFQAIISPHLHYKSSLTAWTDIYFLKKDYRKGGLGRKLFKKAIEEVNGRGVQRFYIGCKVKHDIGPILTRLGFEVIERQYAMVFGE